MRLISVGQVCSLDGSGQLIHQITVELDNGTQVNIVTDEDTVTQLVQAATAGLTRQPVPQPAPEPTLAEPEADPGEWLDGPVEEAAAAPPPPEPPKRKRGRPPKAQSVPQDEFGYPIVQPRPGPRADTGVEDDDGTQI
jgi:hypothetical protein